MTDDSAMITQVLQATHYRALAEGTAMTYREMLKTVHPDKCKHPRAQDATNRLLEMFRHFTSGTTFTDDSGSFLTNDHWVLFQGDKQAVAQARRNQLEIAVGATEHLKRYMPYSWDSDDSFLLSQRAIPLVNLTLPQDHVNWVVSRLLEFCMLLHRHTGRTHLGLTPAQVMLVPETHGIVVAGFYHTSELGGRVQTISAAYRHWYPGQLLRDKKAAENADLEMVKRLGAYLLGDRSGLGTALRKTHHREFVDFLLSSDDDSLACYEKYREMLDKNFPSQFIHLNI
ncbi:hypothetical protein SAMN05216327_105166 [Dyadobacter sp. SG02]|uniref:hypothetical protein n=1 Tax=Dyadobacter sp. SG02 TaxID=1855291 RepID=UPI0008BAB028|nr:hypothetical protein [Dyadobacter sp. SG02]SEI99402.1 hypothetical protein SAMN05216327_105166 [Dyadobacter sp. SG02]